MQVISDSHPEFNGYGTLMKLAPIHGANILILAGDVTGADPRQFSMILDEISGKWRDIIFVPGNHDFYGARFGIKYEIFDTIYYNISKNYKNVHYLNNGSVELGGNVFIGSCLWSNLGIQNEMGLYRDAFNIISLEARLVDFPDFREIKLLGGDFTSQELVKKHFISKKYIEDSILKYIELGKKIHVVSHFPPVHGLFAKDYKDPCGYYSNDLGYMLTSGYLTTWIFGHTHVCHSSMYGKTRLISNAYGYPGEYTGYNPNFVVPY